MSQGNFDSYMRISAESRIEILWWSNNIYGCSREIKVSPSTLYLVTDASMLGWGAVYNSKSTESQWSTEV